MSRIVALPASAPRTVQYPLPASGAGRGDGGARPALIAGGRAPLVGLGVETPVIA